MKNKSLLEQIKYWVFKENEALSKVIEHLQMVADTGLHLELGYASLFQFVTKELGYSEASAQRRIDVLRLQKKIPGALSVPGHNLTTLSLLERLGREAGATARETKEVLALTAGLPTRETEKIIRKRFHLPAKKRRLQIEVEDAGMDLWQQVKGRLAHKNMSEGELLEFLCAEFLRQKDKPSKSESKQSPQARSFGAVLLRQGKVRAGHRCEYVSPLTGRRCDSRFALEGDHRHPYSKGGRTVAANLRILCRNHNKFAWRSGS